MGERAVHRILGPDIGQRQKSLFKLHFAFCAKKLRSPINFHNELRLFRLRSWQSEKTTTARGEKEKIVQ